MNSHRPRNYRVMLLMALFALVVPVSHVSAQKSALSEAGQARIEACRQAILAGQYTDGAIPPVCYQQAGRPASVEPYFANIACLGLLAAHAYTADTRDLPCVARWLEWYADHQEADGAISRFTGTRDANGRLGADATKVYPDSRDSYAATYIALAEAYTRARGAKPKLNAKIVKACKKCLAVLDRCFDNQNGLYWNFDLANIPVQADGTKVIRAQYLLDNTEVYQGLVAAGNFFTKPGDESLAAKARSDANALAGHMRDFWHPADEFFVCLYADKAKQSAWGQQPLSAEGLATVSALAFFDNVTDETRTALWTKLIAKHGVELETGFTTPTYTDEDPAIERVYLAALRAAPKKEQLALLNQLRTRADEFIKRNSKLAALEGGDAALPYPNVHRFGMIIQALLARQSPTSTELPHVPLNPIKAP